MKIIIKTKNLELTNDLQKFIDEKIGSIKKFIDVLKREDEIGKTLAEVFVEVQKETKHHNKGNIFYVKSRVYLPGREIISEVRKDDLFKAIVEAKEELKMEIEKYKFKKIDKNRRQQRKIKKDVEI
jgi:ribosomal subunit interface protein